MAETTYASLALTEEDHRLYEQALAAFEGELGIHYEIRDHDSRGEPLFVYNPANTQEKIVIFNQATYEDVNRVVKKAKNTSRIIESFSWNERIQVLVRAAGIIEKERYNIAAILTYEAGKTRAEALAEVNEVIAMIYNYKVIFHGLGCYYTRQSSFGDGGGEYSESLMRSLGGPVAVIVPFNFPFALAAGMSMAAFLAGNPVVIKASEECPLSTLQWCNILREAFTSCGFPKEACGLLIGGETVGEQLVRHPDIAGVAFTGSLETGKKIMAVHHELWQKNIFRPTPVLEMGGNNPVIVTASADMDKAAEGILRSVLGYSGQKCSAARRLILVGENTGRDLTLAMTKIIYGGGFSNGQKIRLGDPRQRETYLGPLISKQAESRYLELVKSLGSPLHVHHLCQALDTKMSTQDFDAGHYVWPILTFDEREDDAEHFMPVLFGSKAQSLKEAVEKSNRTRFGLTAGIFSEDEKEIEYFLDHIQAGSVYVNRAAGATTGCWPGVQTFGGWKGSGSTGRNAFGKWYILNFLREQNQTIVR